MSANRSPNPGGDRVRKLRDGPRGPVYGVRAQLKCGCGRAFYATLTVGVNRPGIWCPWCKRRSALLIDWHVDGPVVEGATVRWELRWT